MDKRIVDALTKFGLITNIGVDADKYESVDDLIAKGVVTVPEAKPTIMSILAKLDLAEDIIVDEAPVTKVEEDDETDIKPIVEVVDDPAPVIDETPETEVPIVDTPADETPLVEVPTEEAETVVCDDPAEVEVTIVEETEQAKATKKSKKN